MRKAAISRKRKKSETKSLVEFVPFQYDGLKDESLVAETLLDCLREGDVDSFREVLASFLITTNKVQLAKRVGLGRQTLYDILDSKKMFNPELSTIAALFRSLKAG